jgi:A/G-specific adenine glycosylase
MEFGALQCTPSNPNCNECPLKLGCQALKNNTIKLRPVKSKKTAVRNRYFHFLIFEKGSSIIIEKRSDKDIWQNMFQFPLIETLESGEYPDLSVFTENQPHKVSNKIIHILSHQKIQARFYHFDEFPTQTSDKWLVISRTALDDFPLPRLIDRYLEKEN